MDDNARLHYDTWRLIDEYAWAYEAFQKSVSGDEYPEQRLRSAKEKLENWLYENLKDLS